MKTLPEARTLARTVVAIGRAAGKRVTAFLTDMDQPLGRRIGNAIEVLEAILTLKGMGSPDVRELTLSLGAEMLVLGKAAGHDTAARMKLVRAIDTGSALEKLAMIVEAQGGDKRAVLEQKLPEVSTASLVTAPRAGIVAAIEAQEIGLAA